MGALVCGRQPDARVEKGQQAVGLRGANWPMWACGSCFGRLGGILTDCWAFPWAL